MSAASASSITKKLLLAFGVGLIAVSSTLSAGDVRAQGKEPGAFDRDAAMSALKSVNLARCKKPKGPSGDGHVIVTFAPAGSAQEAVVDQAPFAGTKVGKCIASEYRKAKVPAFDGAAISVGKKFQL